MAMNAMPSHANNISFSACSSETSGNIRPERLMKKPKVINARLVRFQDNNERSAEKNTLGSCNSDITLPARSESPQRDLCLNRCPQGKERTAFTLLDIIMPPHTHDFRDRLDSFSTPVRGPICLDTSQRKLCRTPLTFLLAENRTPRAPAFR